ncbi:MAG: DNA mismatch repair endonuclease MutL, partial [Lachnospiraceae bacterium]|nr:DNA mismatch repair endonuclease MutL [Lachnospiraceae bacterium]
MNTIEILDKNTIDKIAAGEVVERPASIVKELVENSIDSGAGAINIEIKDGGISFIRITDNGSGIEADQIKKAFLRHSTSKLRSVEDLTTIHSLGFRGEALSSISAISKVELITKVSGSLTGVRYVIEGGEEKTYQEIGAPDGTTIIIRDVFYNTPARKKFLKSPGTEGSYIASLVERLALSHPDISFNYIQNNATKLHTAGNGSVKDIAYSVFGKEITGNMIPINVDNGYMRLMGYVCKPIVSRGNRNYENYFVNGRFVKNNIITKGIEDAYKSYMMQHRYP